MHLSPPCIITTDRIEARKWREIVTFNARLRRRINEQQQTRHLVLGVPSTHPLHISPRASFANVNVNS